MARRRKELDAVLREARTWPQKDQLDLVEGLLTPELRLRLLVQQARRQVRVRDERRIDRVVDRALRRVRHGEAATR